MTRNDRKLIAQYVQENGYNIIWPGGEMPCASLDERVVLLYFDMDGQLQECLANYTYNREQAVYHYDPYFKRDDGARMVNCVAWRHTKEHYDIFGSETVKNPGAGWHGEKYGKPEKYKDVLLFTRSKTGNEAVSVGYWDGYRWIKKIRSDVVYWAALEMPLDAERSEKNDEGICDTAADFPLGGLDAGTTSGIGATLPCAE